MQITFLPPFDQVQSNLLSVRVGFWLMYCIVTFMCDAYNSSFEENTQNLKSCKPLKTLKKTQYFTNNLNYMHQTDKL